ncbi:MAG TPA: ATP-binding protein [Candidatus Copromorpha excrementigallinarum]|uniref:histidine kinase n=1 Tax=Candidatus Allocopromorpha excrementigallinarum TaxID=2840742 RepID=A0A9D1I2S2_9FIRM|nr:ATP-binding protein [Candidatus Copromorpha excrementigallinarum]
MTRKIFKSITSVSAAVLLICVLCISYVLYGYFGDIIENELRTEARLVAAGMETGDSYLENVRETRNRITVIDEDGTVLFDNKAEASSMDNHGDREEVREAFERGEGSSARYSDTFATKTIYYAVETDQGDVVRVAQDQSMAMLLLEGIIRPFVVILIAVIILSLIFSRIISRRIVAPINEMDLSDKEAVEPYPELAPLMTKIHQQNRHIDAQMVEMERRQREFKTITENMSEGFLLVDSNMEILSYNSAALKLLGSEDVEDPHTAFELNRSKGFRKAVEEALKGRHSQEPLETENNYYNIIANPALENDKVVGAVIIIVDVTEKEQRDKLRREFTSNVSHELKTPLTTIYGVSDMMAEGIVKQGDVKAFGKNIKDESGRMISLIDDIIKLSMLDEDSVQEEEAARINMFAVADEVIKRLQTTADSRKVKLNLKGEDTYVKGVPSLCDEIIYNLCENAIKYNKEEGRVTISVMKEADEAVITVEDTGIGIPAEYRDRVFERFFRVDKSHSSNVSGTGLGLSIVKHAVLHMGGKLELESTEGAGTKITVRLPAE